MNKEKQKELKQYLQNKFDITPSDKELEKINDICQKSEKDYLFPVPEEYRGGFHLGSLEFDPDIPF